MQNEGTSDLVDIDVLKVAHHGSRSSSSNTAIALLKPEWSVISAGEHNRFGHPHPETLWSQSPCT